MLTATIWSRGEAPGSNLVSRVISEEVSPGLRKPSGMPPVIRLQRINGYCIGLGLEGSANAWQSSCREPTRAGAESWPPRRATSACVLTSRLIFFIIIINFF